MPTITSVASATSAVTPAQTTWWLKDPTNAALNVTLRIDGSTTTPVSIAEPEDAAFFAPLGRTRKVKITDVVRGQELHLSLWTIGDAELTALRALRNSQDVLLIQDDNTSQWYVVVDGSFERALLYTGTYLTNPVRKFPVAFIEVDMP